MKRKLAGLIGAISSRTRRTAGREGPRELRLLDSYSMCGLRSLKKLDTLAQDVLQRGVPGDFVECGVWNGGSAGSLGLALRDTDRRIWLYDSFAGLPTPGHRDPPLASNYSGDCIGSIEKVNEAMKIAKLPSGQYIVKNGWFNETFRLRLPQAVALLHIDADWYESVLLSLNTFYGLVPDGGIVVLDDFGHWEGCREAFYDFIGIQGLNPLLERYGYTQAFWVKGKANNRDHKGKWGIP